MRMSSAWLFIWSSVPRHVLLDFAKFISKSQVFILWCTQLQTQLLDHRLHAEAPLGLPLTLFMEALQVIKPWKNSLKEPWYAWSFRNWYRISSKRKHRRSLLLLVELVNLLRRKQGTCWGNHRRSIWHWRSIGNRSDNPSLCFLLLATTIIGFNGRSVLNLKLLWQEFLWSRSHRSMKNCQFGFTSTNLTSFFLFNLLHSHRNKLLSYQSQLLRVLSLTRGTGSALISPCSHHSIRRCSCCITTIVSSCSAITSCRHVRSALMRRIGRFVGF